MEKVPCNAITMVCVSTIEADKLQTETMYLKKELEFLVHDWALEFSTRPLI